MKAYTETEMEEMWRAEMKKREGCSDAFKLVMWWMFDLEEYKKVMRLAHLPNPYLIKTGKTRELPEIPAKKKRWQFWKW